MKTRSSFDVIGDEYEVVALRLSWGALSLACFLLTLPARSLFRLQPWRPEQVWLWPLVPVAAIAVLSFLGLLAGLAGLRTPQSRGTAKVGVLLNAVVLGCIVLVFLGMAAIFYLR